MTVAGALQASRVVIDTPGLLSLRVHPTLFKGGCAPSRTEPALKAPWNPRDHITDDSLQNTKPLRGCQDYLRS